MDKTKKRMIEQPKINNIYDLIELVEKQPEIYLGEPKISSFDVFLRGYQVSTTVHTIENEQVFPPFWYFNEWVRFKYNHPETTAGWKTIILQEFKNSEELALKTCFELIKDFKGLKPISIHRASLSKENIEFHHSDLCKIKSYLNYIKDSTKPLYEKADEIFIVEFSHNFGFSIFIILDKKLIGLDWRERFPNKENAIAASESLFGKSLQWESSSGNHIAYDEIIPLRFLKKNNRQRILRIKQNQFERRVF